MIVVQSLFIFLWFSSLHVANIVFFNVFINFMIFFQQPNADADDDDDYEDEETADDDQSDDSDNTMFEKICELKEVVSENTEATLGKAVLKILYDEDVYGARIIALKVES